MLLKLTNPGLRNRIEIVTKCGIVNPSDKYIQIYAVSHYDTSREHINESVEASLKNMSTDYIDLLIDSSPKPFYGS